MATNELIRGNKNPLSLHSEAEKYATTEIPYLATRSTEMERYMGFIFGANWVLGRLEEYLNNHVQSVSWLPHPFSSITSPMYGDEFTIKVIDDIKEGRDGTEKDSRLQKIMQKILEISNKIAKSDSPLADYAQVNNPYILEVIEKYQDEFNQGNYGTFYQNHADELKKAADEWLEKEYGESKND